VIISLWRKTVKKFLVISLMLIFCSGFAYAEETLSLNGSMRVRAISKIDFDYDGDTDDDAEYWDQRFRLGGAITPAEGISAHFRVDLSEGVWGGEDWTMKTGGWSRGVAGTDEVIQVDRAYLQIQRDLFTLQAGQFWAGWGNYTLMDHQTTGLYTDINVSPVVVSLHYAKLDEDPVDGDDNEGTVDDIDGFEDVDLYAGKVGFNADAFSVAVMYAGINDQTDADVSPQGIGVQGTGQIGPVALNASLDYFSGSNGDNDWVGTQFYLNAGYNVIEPLTLSVLGVFALGNDEADEDQRTAITAGGESFNPLGWQGSLATTFYPVGSLYGGSGGGVFDPTGSDGGVQGAGLGVDYIIMKGLALYARVGYLTPQEDANTDINSFTTAALNVDYTPLTNTTISAGYGLTKRDVDNDLPDDTKQMAILALKVSF
jgi:hypothetical protein